MEIKVYRITFAILLFGTAGYSIFWNIFPTSKAQYLSSFVPVDIRDGVFHWRYENGWDFRVEITSKALHWEGIGGDFEGTSMSVTPHYRQIREQLYFISWVIPFGGFDSILVDFENDRVFAHSKANNKFFSLEGEIYCDSRKALCEPPSQHLDTESNRSPPG